MKMIPSVIDVCFVPYIQISNTLRIHTLFQLRAVAARNTLRPLHTAVLLMVLEVDRPSADIGCIQQIHMTY